MTASAPTVALRPAREGDSEFLARLYASTRSEELAQVPWTDVQKAAFLQHQFDAQSAHYAEHYAGAAFDVVLVDGRPAGRLIVARWPAEIRVVDISLLPGFRARGVGTRLLTPILAEADERGVPVSVHVEQFNPARRLYERLGFTLAGEVGIYLRLDRPPGGGQAKIAS